MAGSKISALTAIATVDDTDLFPVVDTSATTLKKMTRAQLRKLIADSPTDLAVLRYSSGSADWLVTTPSAMITGLTAITTLADADLLPINQSTTGKKVSVEQLRKQIFASPTTSAFVQYVGSDWVVRTPTQAAASVRPVFISSPADGDMLIYSSTSADFVAHNATTARWRTIATARYTTTIGGTPSIITMSNTGDFAVGLPVRYVVSGTTYYGICTALTANTSITVAGPALAAAATISALAVGSEGMVTTVQMFVANAYGDSVNALLASDMKTYIKWNRRKSYLVRFSVTHNTAAGTTQPTVNVQVNGSNVSTSNSGNGILPTSAGTWVDNTLASIDSATYDINWDESLSVACTVVGSPTGGALDLTVLCVFVEE